MTIFAFLFFVAIVCNAPLMLIIWLARERLGALAGASMLAVGFSVTTAYCLWRVEWYDVWRHGIPSVRYLCFAYLPYLVVSAVIGWLVATLVVPCRRDLHIER